MCTTATDSPRPCDRCDSGIATGTGTKDAHGQTEWLCAGCAERLSQPEYTCDDEWAPEDPGIDGDHPTGYEADDERPYGWDVPEEEYPDW